MLQGLHGPDKNPAQGRRLIRIETTVTTMNETLKVIVLEDGSSAVVKVDSVNPRLLEVVATFFDATRAQDYAKLTLSGKRESEEPQVAEPKQPAAPKEALAKSNGTAAPDLSPRQSAVLNALRAKMNEDKQVEAKAADLAEAAQIPLGSLHSVLGSLEKKQLIVNTRAGSPRSPAVYQVL